MRLCVWFWGNGRNLLTWNICGRKFGSGPICTELLALFAAFSFVNSALCTVSLLGDQLHEFWKSESKCFRAGPVGSSLDALIFHKMGHKVCAGLRWSATSKCWSSLKDGNPRWFTLKSANLCWYAKNTMLMKHYNSGFCLVDRMTMTIRGVQKNKV